MGQLKWDAHASTQGTSGLGAPAAIYICIQATHPVVVPGPGAPLQLPVRGGDLPLRECIRPTGGGECSGGRAVGPTPTGGAQLRCCRHACRGEGSCLPPTTTFAQQPSWSHTQCDPRGTRHCRWWPSSCSPAQSPGAAPVGTDSVVCRGGKSRGPWAGSGLTSRVSGCIWKGLHSWVGRRRGNPLGACQSS